MMCFFFLFAIPWFPGKHIIVAMTSCRAHLYAKWKHTRATNGSIRIIWKVSAPIYAYIAYRSNNVFNEIDAQQNKQEKLIILSNFVWRCVRFEVAARPCMCTKKYALGSRGKPYELSVAQVFKNPHFSYTISLYDFFFALQTIFSQLLNRVAHFLLPRLVSFLVRCTTSETVRFVFQVVCFRKVEFKTSALVSWKKHCHSPLLLLLLSGISKHYNMRALVTSKNQLMRTENCTAEPQAQNWTKELRGKKNTHTHKPLSKWNVIRSQSEKFFMLLFGKKRENAAKDVCYENKIVF